MLMDMGSSEQHKARQSATSRFSSLHDETSSESTRLAEVLSELQHLLEEYGPSWYTERHHRKIELALHPRRKH